MFKKGDKVRCLINCDGQFTEGKVYTICEDNSGRVELDDRGSNTNGLYPGYFVKVCAHGINKDSNYEFCHQCAIPEKTSAQRKDEPLYSGVLMYFPDALLAVSRVSKKGNDKHNPGQPLYWNRSVSSDHMDCVTRHIITPEEIDPDSGEVHLAHAAWRVLAALQLLMEKKK